MNLILASQLSKIKGKNIEFIASQFDDDIPMDKVDFYVLLGNLLDNAIENCTSKSIKKIILDIVKNPLIISSVLGIIFSLLGIRLPTAVDTTVQDLAKLSTPIAFMILGGDLDFSKVRGNLKVASVVLTIKLVILPLIMIPMIVMMGYRDADLLSGLLAYQTPVAVSSYIMAQQAGADGQLAGQLVVFSSVLSIFTLFVTILILRTIGLLGI